VFVADTAEDFARRAADLLENTAMQEKLSSNGRKLAETKYDWQVVLSAMKKIYEQ
jgi:glycosyltransferase involved in cell wall biosynthesis